MPTAPASIEASDLSTAAAKGVKRPVARILIVEDESIVALDLENTLIALSYSVVATASNGEQAVKLASALRPDLVLMDIRLAGDIDGVEAAGIIQHESNTPVVYLTAHSDDELIRRAAATKPYSYLVKPFQTPELRCAIELALQRHKDELRLREREQWLVTTLRSIGDGVIATDAEHQVAFLNPIAESFTGWKHNDALGKNASEILSLVKSEDGAAIESPLRRALQQRCIITIPDRTLLLSRSGDARFIANSAAPIVGDDGRILGGVLVFRDVTEQHRRDEELRRLNAELEHRVVERTHQLEAACEELEAFSCSVAHDLRAPLRSIDSFSQIIMQDHTADLEPEALEHFGRVRVAAKRMGQIIDDLLRLSRVTRRGFLRRTVDLSRLAGAVTEQLRGAHPDREVEIAVEPDIVVEGDERLLQIVLENLIGNAWKFTAGVLRARIEVGRYSREDRSGCLVRDNGAGFDERYAHQLFVAFQRLHRTGEFEGTGIGLAIVQRIIRRHNGRIWAEGAVGRGATFSFVV